ncbi:MAG: hypothetical protein ACK4MV_10740 [Beijerinckiaceae bacterium]
MLKTIAVGLVGGLVALAANWSTGVMIRPSESVVEKPVKPQLEVKKAGGLNVPILRQGALQGYMVVQLGYSIEVRTDAPAAGAIEGILLDEAFRAIYADSRLDHKSLQSYDFAGLTKQLRESVRRRISADGLKEVLIQEFNFVPAGGVR